MQPSARDVARPPALRHVDVECDRRRHTVEFVELAGHPVAEHRAVTGSFERDPRAGEEGHRGAGDAEDRGRTRDPVTTRDCEVDLTVGVAGRAGLRPRKDAVLRLGNLYKW